ncbi:hypothetical protein [Vibrio parahaemolyticus]|uniref:hypothetical protein n=1 Tax=Vibrio parahaemolyticus TaxID=670 RepID=UPI00214AAFB5|nr:hypothetical protein [Vibrio parahaemolyticus]
MVELEKARQLKQALDVGLDDTQKEQVAAVLTTLSGFAMFTPLAPLAAGYFVSKVRSRASRLCVIRVGRAHY